jgi:phage/plasmid primase-like uncharacterized protein
MNAADEFRRAIEAAGLTPPADIPPGIWIKFPGHQKGVKNRAAWCFMFDDMRGGQFGDYTTGMQANWQAGNATPYTSAEREDNRQHFAAITAQREAEATQRHESAATDAAQRLAKATPCTEHAYTTTKGVQCQGLRVDTAGALIVPMIDTAGKTHSLQAITPDGDKRFMSSGRVKGCYHAIGKPAGLLIVCEGYATGASIHESTGHAVAVTFNAGNLEPVAVALRAKYPALKIIIAADDDWKTDGNPGLSKATAAAQTVGGFLAVPSFPANRPDKATDFNDLHQLAGAGAVKDCIEAAALCGTAGAKGVGPPEPFVKATPPTPWPADCMPHGMARAAEAIAEHVQAPAALAGLAVLGAVTHIVMRLLDARHPKKGVLHSSLYILVELLSGGRKSECFNLATAPIAKIERALRETHRAEVKRLEAEAARSKPKDRAAIMSEAPADPRTIFVDTTTQAIEHAFVNDSAPALSLSTDEGGSLLGGHSLKSETRAASLGGLTRLFDGAGVQRDRIGEGQSGFRYGVRFGLFLSAQPVVLAEALSDPMLRGQGFLPRFIYSAPASLAGTRFHDEHTLSKRVADDERIVGYWKTLEAMCEAKVVIDEHVGLCLPTVGMNAEAVNEWLAFYNDTERQQGEGREFSHMQAFASRAGELAARVAAVYACWRCFESRADLNAVTVTGSDMRQAVALVGHSLAEWARHGEGVALEPVELDARTLLAWLHSKGFDTITRMQIGKLCPNYLRKDTKRRNQAIDELTRRGWLIDTSSGIVVVKNEKTESGVAVAVSAVSADGRDTANTANNATATAHLNFSPEPPKKRAPAVDVAGSVAALLGENVEVF